MSVFYGVLVHSTRNRYAVDVRHRDEIVDTVGWFETENEAFEQTAIEYPDLEILDVMAEGRE